MNAVIAFVGFSEGNAYLSQNTICFISDVTSLSDVLWVHLKARDFFERRKLC